MTRTHFGKYAVTELIGEGGFGQVFKGLDPDLKRPVAIKTCSLQQEDMRERFYKEAEIAARLQHPNITTVYDFGRVDGEPYLVQEYLTGEDLDDIIKRGDPLPLDAKLRILLQIAEGLRYAHSRGVIHRDVKPANMRVLEDGQLRIMDFGIAKLVEETQRLTQVGMTLGTAGYLSPEQLLGLEIDQRADIFSFGVLAYELVTYRAPFQADSISALFYSIAHDDPPPVEEVWAGCPPALAAFLERCLEKDREARYGDFSRVLNDLRGILAALETGEMAFAGSAVAGGAGATGAVVGSGRDAGVGSGAAGQAPGAIVGSPPPGRGRGRRVLWGVAAVALLLAAFEVVRFTMPGATSPPPEGFSVPPTSDSTRAGEEAAEPVALPEAQEPSPSAAQEEPAPPSRTVAPSDQPRPTPAETETETGAGEAPYRGTNTMVLFWSSGGDPEGASTAENAFLEELGRRGMAVVEAGLLRGIHGDAAAMASVQGLDAGTVATLGRQYGAEVVVVGSLRTEAAPSAGQFYTGRAVLDLRAYSASGVELLGASTQQVGTGGTPGKLGASPLAAEAEAAREVGRLAAVQVAREYGSSLPRRR